MKSTLAVLLSILTSATTFSQSGKFQCPCSEIGLNNAWADSNKISCYLIPVKQDTRKAAGSKLRLAVLVAPALNGSNKKPLLYLHGGPGIATVENAPRYLKSKTWKTLRENNPLIFMDYRGTGYSEPRLCPGLEDSLRRFAMGNPTANASRAYKIELYKQCREQLYAAGTDIATFNSVQLAADADEVRSSLGIKNWNVYGVSFGTSVALNMLRDQEAHISSMILDSPFPPNAPWLDFIRPFDTSFKILEKHIAADPATRNRFQNLRSDFVNAVNRLNKQPVKLHIKPADQTIDFTGNDFAWSIWKAMLSPKSIPFVPLAIHETANGNDSVLSKWITAFKDPNSFGKFSEPQSNAILCMEGRPRNIADTRASLLKNYPDFASLYVDFEGDLCTAWQPATAAASFFDPVVSNKPVLILSGEYDPVCPPLFGALASQSLANSTFINVPAASHAAIHVNECVLGIASSFLKDPQTKPLTVCVGERESIHFITENLPEALNNIK